MFNQYAAQWTQTAIDCYNRGCVCKGCNTGKILETPCRMKKAVLELVRKLGKPTDCDGLTKKQQKVVDAILSGCNNKYEISEKLGFKASYVQGILQELYKIAESDGVVFKNKRDMISDFVKWVRGIFNGKWKMENRK